MSSPFSHYGRIGRLEWWIVMIAVGAIFYGLAHHMNLPTSPTELMRLPQEQVLNLLALGILRLVFEGLAAAKRYHDLDRSGWEAWKLLIPIVGGIWVTVECGFFAGTPGENEYGPAPGRKRATGALSGSRAAELIATSEASTQARLQLAMPSSGIFEKVPVDAPRRAPHPKGFGRRGLAGHS